MAAKLSDRIRWVLRVRHGGQRTLKACLDWIWRFIRFRRMHHPALRRKRQLQAVLIDLAVNPNLALTTEIRAFNALFLLCWRALKADFQRLDKVLWRGETC